MNLNILNLGAGVQSSTIYYMMTTGEVAPADHAIFADTQEEPKSVYTHLEYLKSLGGPPIHVVTKGKLGDDLMRGENSTHQRFASIPAFTAAHEGEPLGIIRRQCTREYKIQPIERHIRRVLLGLKKGQRLPKGTELISVYGISLDECARAMRIKGAAKNPVVFPLIDKMMTREDCKTWCAEHGFNIPQRSACVFCPYKTNNEWLRLKNEDPIGWFRAVEVDAALRIPGRIVNRKLNQKLYVHKSCVPLSEAALSDDDIGQLGFWQECQGMCGV